MAFILIAGVLVIVIYGIFSKRSLEPLVAAVLVSTYSVFSLDYIPVMGFGEMEVGYFSLLGFWGLMGAVIKTERRWLIGSMIRYVMIASLTLMFLRFVAQGTLGFIDVAGIVCWLVSIGCYLLLIQRWGFWRHILAATVAALMDLAVYYVLGVIFKMDPAPFPEVLDVYFTGLMMIVPLVLIYSLPLLFLKANSERPELRRISLKSFLE